MGVVGDVICVGVHPNPLTCVFMGIIGGANAGAKPDAEVWFAVMNGLIFGCGVMGAAIGGGASFIGAELPVDGAPLRNGLL
jgi:hypothetical protein